MKLLRCCFLPEEAGAEKAAKLPKFLLARLEAVVETKLQSS
jgi:hypothetical protein